MNFKLVVFYGLISYVSAIEPVSAFGGIGTALVAGFYTAYSPIKCHFYECCTSNWINLNTTGSLYFLFTDEIVNKVKDNFSILTKVMIIFMKIVRVMVPGSFALSTCPHESFAQSPFTLSSNTLYKLYTLSTLVVPVNFYR